MDRGVQKIRSTERAGSLIALSSALAMAALLVATVARQPRNLDAATQLFARFDAHQGISDDEASALRELFLSDHETRSGFLHLALANDATVKRFDLHRHAFAVALSTVDRHETRVLFESEIVPALKESRDVLVLQECFYLMLRWSIHGAIQERERDRLASALVQRIIHEKDASVRNELASGIRIFENIVSGNTAENLALRLTSAILKQVNPNTIRALSAALGVFTTRVGPVLANSLSRELLIGAQEALRPERKEALLNAFIHAAVALDSSGADEAAARLTEWLSMETSPLIVRAVALAFQPLEDSMSMAKADASVEVLARRIESGNHPDILDSYFVALRSIAPRVSAEQAEWIAPVLLKILTGINGSGAAMSASVISALGNRLPPNTTGQAREILLARLRNEQDVRLFSALAFNLGTLSSHLPKNGFQEAALVVAGRIAQQEGAYEISLLDGALSGLVKPGIEPVVASQIAHLLVDRIQREREIPNLLRVVAALQLIAEHVPEDDAPLFVAKLIERINPESGGSTLRAIGFAIGSFSEGARQQQINAAAAKFIGRITKEPDPAVIRMLVAGLVNLGENVPKSSFERVATRLNHLLSIADAADLPDLAASLAALEDNISDDQMEFAADAIVKAALDANASAGVDSAAVAFGKISDDLDPSQVSELVERFIQGIGSERKEAMVRARGEFLSRFPPGSISTAQLKQNQKMLSLPNAPCLLAALVDPPHRTEFAAQAVQNPLCSETSWDRLSFILVPPPAGKDADEDDEEDADFRTLIVADDDGESDTEEQGLDSFGVDFNRLSNAVDPYRILPQRR